MSEPDLAQTAPLEPTAETPTETGTQLEPTQTEPTQTEPTQLEPNWWLFPLLVFLGSRLALALIVFLAALALPEATTPDRYHYAQDNLWIDGWARWDSTFYLEIANQGYQVTLDEPSNVAFFPLYPLLIRTLEPVFASPLLAALFVSNASFLVALLLLYRVTQRRFDSQTAQRAVLYLAIFPTSFYFAAIYTESLFLLLSLIAFACARAKRFAWASLAVTLAAVTRPTGILLGLPLLLEWFTGRPRKTLEAGWFLVIPFGLVSFMVFLARAFNDPLAFWNTQSAFGRRGFDPTQPFAAITRDLEPLTRLNLQSGPVAWNVILDLGVLAGVLLLAPAIWRSLGAGWALYSLLSMLVPTASGTGSLARYALVVFPAAMVLALRGRNANLDRAIQLVSPIVLGLLAVLFSRWVFVD
jgi:Mannosyltransferase (PIG-V)